jgi:hypothetical protein
VPSAVLHECTTKIAICSPPSASEICDRVVDIPLGLEKPANRAPVAEERGGFRTYLHQTDLAKSAASLRVVRALDLRDGIRKLGWNTIPLCLSTNEREVSVAPFRVRLSQSYEIAHLGRQGQQWKRRRHRKRLVGHGQPSDKILGAYCSDLGH